MQSTFPLRHGYGMRFPIDPGEARVTIIIHHLENSRSQRVIWLLEEVGLPYEIRHYARNKKTMLAPPELRAVHPLGKSPVIEDTDTGSVVAETGAIVEYLVTLQVIFLLDDEQGFEDEA